MQARIYKPARTAMQSGTGNTEHWLLEYHNPTGRFIEPLMGWTGSTSTLGQVQLRFPTREEAEAYARREGLTYTVQVPQERRLIKKAYADNFAFSRVRTPPRPGPTPLGAYPSEASHDYGDTRTSETHNVSPQRGDTAAQPRQRRRDSAA